MNTKPQTLSPKNVRYLSFEGGGGKGAAYLGALAAFAHPEVGLLRYDATTDDYYLRRWTSADEPGIKGVAGASVGAITASLLASGWGVRALYEDVVSDRTALAGFFDAAETTHRSVPVALRPERESSPRAATTTSCLDRETRPAFVKTPGTQSVRTAVERVVAFLSRNPAVRQFFRHPTGHLRNLRLDYGLFSGCAGQSFLETSVEQGRFVAREATDDADGATESSDREITFREHRERTGLELVLTGTNLRTGRGEYLSDRHGLGQMKVADGVRISMGLPLLFKPVRVSRGAPDRRYEGLWVDGGVLNNNPIHAFDHGSDGTLNEAVLGLRLEEDTDNEITNLLTYIAAVGKTYLGASETREIRTQREERRSISLPIPEDTLGLFEFTPSDGSVWKASVEAANAVYDYFGIDASPESALSEVVGLRAP